MNFWASWVHSLKLIKDVKLLGTTYLIFPWSTSLTTLRNLAISPSWAKVDKLEMKRSSRPLFNLYPSSVLLITLTMMSESLGTIPVGRIVTTLVEERYSWANWLRFLILCESSGYLSSSPRFRSTLDAWYSIGSLESPLMIAQLQ